MDKNLDYEKMNKMMRQAFEIWKIHLTYGVSVTLRDIRLYKTKLGKLFLDPEVVRILDVHFKENK